MADQVASFYFHPRMLDYNFGPNHPFKPDRLERAVALLANLGIKPTDPGLATIDDALRVHDEGYLDAIAHAMDLDADELSMYGISPGDTPAFPNMLQGALNYSSGSVAAAREVCNGAKLATTLAGGLHHAQRNRASGFCVLDDCAMALSILREKFERVAYVDIDVHHGDGVQAIFYDDPTVLTCSIHQDGRTLYPGTGWVDETGADFSSINVPLLPGTTADVWLWAFRNGILLFLKEFKPGAIVLQMGADTHFSDPLAHINNTAQSYLEAVRDVKGLGIPLVALGGGGYNITSVVRMWAAAILTLNGLEIPGDVPEPFAGEWNMPKFFDPEQIQSSGQEQAEKVVAWLETH
ncbi:MAG TPA: hypothetical protein VGL56_17150 [Fimbriimonadaceae bacterium]|jgi:acetoin utilization protein AcuC